MLTVSCITRKITSVSSTQYPINTITTACVSWKAYKSVFLQSRTVFVYASAPTTLSTREPQYFGDRICILLTWCSTHTSYPGIFIGSRIRHMQKTHET